MSKKFVSFLGTKDYEKTHYVHNGVDAGGYISRFIQEALVKTICKDWDTSSKAIVFITKEAKKINWYNEEDENRRLKILLKNTQLESKGILIPSGKNEEEI